MLLAFILAATTTWQTDWNAAFRIAKEQHKLVFVDYTASWCGPCLEVETITFRGAEMQSRMSNFVFLKVDVDTSEIPRAHRVVSPLGSPTRKEELPAYLVYDYNERPLFRISGPGAQSLVTAQNLDEINRAAPALIKAAE